MRLLNERIRITRSIDGTVAGTTDISGAGIDMELDGGYDGVMFIAALGVLTATQVSSLKAQVSSDDGGSDAYADLAGTDSGDLADDDDDKMIVLDIFNPPERWVRPVLLRGTANAVIDSVIAIQYSGRNLPPTHGSTVAFSENIVGAAEGTA